MAQTVAQLSSRLNKLEMEYKVAERRRIEEIDKAVTALASIKPEDVELLKGVVPELSAVVKFTKQDLMDDMNGEVAMLRKVTTDLESYLERRLTFYEEQL